MQHHDGVTLLFSLGLADGGIAFVRSEAIVEWSLDSFRGRRWVWLPGEDRAARMMQKIVGPFAVVAGAGIAAVSAYRLLA